MNKDTVYKYIIYKIFTSKYKDLFVLDGSYGLYLSIDKDNKRKFGDLDLNDLSFTNSKNKQDNIDWTTPLNVIKEIFEDNPNISIKLNFPRVDLRKFNIASSGSKLIFKLNGDKFPIDFSLIFNSMGSKTLNWCFANDSDLTNYLKLNKNQSNIKIQVFDIEKYLANKILTIVKITDTFKYYDNDISKSVYDIWYIIKDDQIINKDKLSKQFDTMYDSNTTTNKIIDSFIYYLKGYLKIDSKNLWLDNFIQFKVENSNIISNQVFTDIINYFEKGEIYDKQ